MSLVLHALAFDAQDPERLAGFWGGVLGRAAVDDGRTLAPDTETDFLVRFLPTDRPKVGSNQMHFDLTSTSLDDQQAVVQRALALGATRLDGRACGPDAVALADPDGNELCLLPAP